MELLFIIGAQRSGSTYLYKILDAHPEIYMAKPIRPEPKFFLNSERFAKGRGFYEESYFSSRLSSHRYIGEKGTSYIESVIAAERIKAFYPEARILMILRNPAERAYSNYKFSVSHGIESASFSDAIAAENKRIETTAYSSSVNPYAYQTRGYYINYIEEYLSVFERSQMKIMIFEEFVGNLSAISDLYAWLGVDAHFVPGEYKIKENASNVEGLQVVTEWDMNQLSEQYDKSNRRLESFLGREVKAWRPE